MEIKYLDVKQLEAMTTVRLLAYYKKLLPRIRKYQASFYCECCGAPTYEINAKLYSKEENEKRKNDHKETMEKTESYLSLVKSVLSTREHIPYPYKNKK